MALRPYVAAAAAVAALSTVTALAAPAHAVPPTTRTVPDAVEPGKGYDVTEVVLRAAPTSTRPAVIKVRHARPVEPGDALEVWFDLDGDKVPDVHLSGTAFSEYSVSRTRSFTRDGEDISEQDCVRLSMAGRTSKIRMFPGCLDDPVSYAVSVKSSGDDGPDDWAPRAERFTKKVLAAPPS